MNNDEKLGKIEFICEQILYEHDDISPELTLVLSSMMEVING